ncbi:MAG: hypothetical protein MUC43_18725 [Pirellula sp.]|nr:hypothetical protein [Pirellula sp.]
MMNAWIRKEAKDILRWTPIGMVILSLALWGAIRSLGPYTFSELSSNLYIQTVIASGAFGLFLGFVTFWFDANGAARGYLVHRGVSLSRIFLIRTLFGFMAYMIAMWIPLLCCGFYISTIGPATLPVTPYAIVPALVAVVYCFGFFFAGSMIACRASRWFGSRLLPLLGALALPTAMIPMFPGQWFVFLLTGGLGVLGLILQWVSTRSAFVRGSSQPTPSQSFHLPMVERVMILLSTVVATLVAFTLFMMATMPQHQSWSTTRVAIRFAADGTPWLVEQPTNYWDYENPNEHTRTIARLTNESSDERKPEAIDLQYGYEFHSRFLTLANRFDLWDMTSLGEYSEFQYYGNQELVYVYSKVGGTTIPASQLIAVVGPKTVGNLQNLPSERFKGYPVLLPTEENPSNANQIIDSSFWIASNGVYRFDIQSRNVQHISQQPIQRIAFRTAGSRIDEDYQSVITLFVMNGHSICIYEANDRNQREVFASEPITKIQLPRDLDLSNCQGGMLWFQDAKNWTFVPLKFSGNYDQEEFQVVRSQNDTIAQSTIKSPINPRVAFNDFSSRENQEMLRVMLLMPPILVSGASFIAHFLLGETVLWNSIWLLGLLQAVVSGMLCFIAARYRCLSRGRSLTWFVLGGLFGLGTWAAMLAIYPRVYRVRCANCGRMRRIENEHCEKCGATWEPLEPLGIELLSEPLNRPQHKPVAQPEGSIA